MDFAFTDEQERCAASPLVPRRALPGRARRRARRLGRGWDPGSWAELAELGWLGASVPEEAGGAGLGFLEEAVLFEELGRALYPGPFFSTVALALPELPRELQAEVAAGATRWSASLDGASSPTSRSSTACSSRATAG